MVHKHHLPLEGVGGLIQGFGGSTLCGCVTVMAVGYRAQGQGGSKEMYFYSCFQGTVLVQRLMSQERCKPPSNKSPSPKPRGPHRFPSTISTENVIVSQVGSNFFDTKAKRPTHIICLWALGQKEQKGQQSRFGVIEQLKGKKISRVTRPTCRCFQLSLVCNCITESHQSRSLNCWILMISQLITKMLLAINLLGKMYCRI